MSRIDVSCYRQHGGDVQHPPYIDVAERGIYAPVVPGVKRVRAFVNAAWYPKFDSWRAAADAAVDTVLFGTNPIIEEAGIRITEAAELDPFPRFIFDRSRTKYGTVSTFLNAAPGVIDTAEKFSAVLIVAEARRRLIEAGAVRKNSVGDEFTQYSPSDNGDRFIWDILDGTTVRFTPEQEAVIRSLMELDACK